MRPLKLADYILVGLLAWALMPFNPYGYYIFLRIVCCGYFGYAAYKAHNAKQEAWAWIWGIMAVVYNPIVRIHLTREIWTVVNLVAVGMIVWARLGKKQEC